jgi:hypothetical protein
MFFKETNSFNNFFAVIGTIFGNPSNINCFCSSKVSFDLILRDTNSLFGFF